MLPFNLRFLMLFAMAAMAPLCAEWTLYTCMASSKGYVVGAKLKASGLARRTAAGKWEQMSHNHPFMFAVDSHPLDVDNLYVAAGNGLIRIPRRDNPFWKILTAEDVTELRDITIDPQGRIIFAHSAGIRLSGDRGKTWTEITSNLPHKFSEAIRADRARPGVLLVGGEDGIWRSDNSGAQWRRAGGAGNLCDANRAVAARPLLLARRNAKARVCSPPRIADKPLRTLAA